MKQCKVRRLKQTPGMRRTSEPYDNGWFMLTGNMSIVITDQRGGVVGELERGK